MSTESYEEIVNNSKGPTLVLAGPGSGKTYLLADRVVRLLRTGINREAITLLTYTTDANQNMIDKLMAPNPGGFALKFDELPKISTMHSLGFSILQDAPHSVNLLKTDLTVQENENIKRLIYRDASLILGFSEADGESARGCKQHGDCRQTDVDKKCKICKKYWEIMSKCNRVDFDDQILFACRILESDPDLLNKYQSRSTHLLVDEYQDINAGQFKLIELLSRKSRDGLFVVGDDAQSIYGFRGGDPKFILRFKQDFPGSKVNRLAVSRRCHENIMGSAFKVLEKYYKEWSRPRLEYQVTSGDRPYVYQVPSEIREAEVVARIAESCIRENKDVLILAPKEDLFPLIREHLLKHGIYPDCSVRFLLPERIEIANRFLSWVQGPDDSFLTRLVVEDLINVGIAKVPGANKKRLKSEKSKTKRIAAESKIARLWEFVNKEENLFGVIRDSKDSGQVITVIKDGLNRLLSAYNDFKKDPGEFAKLLSYVSGIWTEPMKLAEDVSQFVKLVDSSKKVVTGTVLLRTMRKAKGLEANVVVVVGLEDDVVPNPRGDICEEARLFYVSLTRAREKLYLVHSYRRGRNLSYGDELMNKQRSRFLDVLGIESKYIGG